jgi:AraC family transcriptional regulator
VNSLEKLNAALRYIEENLDGTINYTQVARRANCSEYHFKRVFSFLAGVPLSEYIRRRRLTLAADDLRGGQLRVLDVAMKYGYESADSFARAFSALHGVTPGEVRRGNQTTQSFSPLTFALRIQGGTTMEYRIIEKTAFTIVGICKRVSIQFHGVNTEIAAMWKSLDQPTIERLKGMNDTDPKGMISGSVNFSSQRMEEKGQLDHYIGVATTAPGSALESGSEDFDSLPVAAGTWAVFPTEGPFPDTLQETWGRIYSEWLPSTHYELVQGPELLWIKEMDNDSSRCSSEIWIPVRHVKE